MEYHSTIWPSRHFDILIWKIFSSKIATEEWLIWLIYQILTWSNYHRHVEKYDIKSQHGGSYGVCYGRKKLRMYSGITRFTIINGSACASSSLTLQLLTTLKLSTGELIEAVIYLWWRKTVEKWRKLGRTIKNYHTSMLVYNLLFEFPKIITRNSDLSSIT